MTINYDAARTVLNNERSKLVHQLEELGATETGDLRSDVQFGDGFADAGAATAERTEVLGLVESLKRQVDSVDAALGKIDAGTYGICATCGKQIGADRMEFRPTSVRCMDCKTRDR
jgi:RNA polymerase-binding protein DksA